MLYVEWILSYIFGSPLVKAHHVNRIFNGLVASIRSGHMFVKSSVFGMINGLLRKFLTSPSSPEVAMYLNALPLDKLLNHAKARLALERTVESRATRTRYFATLLDLVTTLKFFEQAATKERSSLPAPEIIPLHFASTATTVTIAWQPLHKPQKGDNLFKKKSEVIYCVDMRDGNNAAAEWKNIYEGSSTSVTRENLPSNTCYAFRLQVKRGETFSEWSSLAYASTMGKGISMEVSDPKKRGDGLKIDNNGRSVTKVDGAQSWRTVVGTESFKGGVHYWEIYVDLCEWGSMAFGLGSSKKLSLTNCLGYAFANFRGLIGGHEGLYGEFYGPGNIVGCLLDMDQRQISFFKDKKPLGVAFSNVKVDELTPIFSVKHASSKLTLMPESYSYGGTPTDALLKELVELGQVFFALGSKSRTLPKVFVKRSFNNWKVWCKQMIQRHVTRAGFEVEVNISDSKLAPWKCKHGDRVSSPDGEKIILGVHGGLLWHRPARNLGDHNGVWFWSKSYVEEWKAEIVVVEKSKWVPDECQMKDLVFNRFDELLESEEWTLERDAAICQAFNRAARSQDMAPFNLGMASILKEAAMEPLLEGLSKEMVSVRAAFLRELNNSQLPSLLVSVGYEDRADPWSLGGLVSSLREVLFLHTKEQTFQWFLAHTTQLTNLRDDEYTDPSNLMTIAVNREKAQRYAESPDLEKRKRSSLFFQMQERLRQMGVGRRAIGTVANLRQKYTGILDAGQSRTFKVTFQNEGVTDNGGPYRETFSHFCSELHSEVLNLLVECPNARSQIGDHQEAFVFNCRAKSKSDLELFHFMGQMIGIAIRCDIPLEMRWPKFVWKRMVGLPVVQEDIKAVDEALFHVVDDVLATETEEVFSARFADLFFCIHTYDGEEQMDLIPNGSEIAVSFDRRQEWVDKVLEFKLLEGTEQIDEMMAGLATIIPTSELCCFTPEEMEIKICGEPHINIDVLRMNVVYDGCSEDEPQVKWLWETLDEMDQTERALFLQFVWSRTRLPVSASQMLMKFKIQSAPDSVNSNPNEHLPLSHTCFFSISVPKYTEKSILKTKLSYAIKHCRSMDSDFRLHNSDLVMTRSN
jgi:hypothetical protein